ARILPPREFRRLRRSWENRIAREINAIKKNGLKRASIHDKLKNRGIMAMDARGIRYIGT
ncbi:MAG: hypothetical protein LBS84_10925, partial [Clostridiales bacterium]|nr:hypothetical protein [Clostridiales bacterium]